MNQNKYYAIYKPYKVMTQFSPVEGKNTLKDFLELPTDIYPIGRLDYDSEGLLILTNDNAFKNELLNPQRKHKRCYLVQVEGSPNESQLEKLRKSVTINVNGKLYKTKPAYVEMINDPQVPERIPPIRFRKNIPTTWLKITLTEGKNRQVRKMTASIGFPTLRLIRFSIGEFSIENLPQNNHASQELPPISFLELNQIQKSLLLK